MATAKRRVAPKRKPAKKPAVSRVRRPAISRLSARNPIDEVDDFEPFEEDEGEDDFDLRSEMREGVTISDSGGWRGGSYTASHANRTIADGKTVKGVLRKVKAWMKKSGYYPNIFYVNDHGNVDLIDGNGDSIRSWV